MERRKSEDVIFYVDKVNEILKKQGKDFYYHYSSRYGYKAIDKCYYYNSGCSDYMTGLTVKEAYNIIYAVYQTLIDENHDSYTMPLLQNYSLQQLYNICGYREFEILRTAKHEDVELIMCNKDHKVFKIYDEMKENYFEYDIINNKIVG